MEGLARFLAKITVGVAGVLALLSALSFVQDTPGSPLGAPAVGVASGEELELVGVRGEDIEFAIIDNAVGGRWASETGLSLTVRSEETGFERTFDVAEPEEKDWDDSLVVSQRSDHEFDIRAEFELPDVPGPETQVLTGTITGDFQYPDASGSDSFSDVQLDLAIPVTLRVVTESEAEELRAPAQTTKLLRFLVGIPAVVISFAYIIIWASWRDGELSGKRWPVPWMVGLGAGVWILGAISWTRGFFSG
jgi:hypothetical protein